MTASEGTPARSGALTTGLNTALEHAREALAPHAGLLEGGTLAALDDMLAELARRRVRIALYGEVKAGKSTLLNAVAGSALSPMAFEPLTSVPVRITYGEETVWRIADRTLASAEELGRLMRDEEEAADEVVVETDLDLLQLGGQVDLIDTPGVGSEARFDTVTGDVLRSLDAVVLVVRYPALFTEVTRRLMDGLQAEMGKLFVVWNLDQACAELTAAERTRHTETLRANVAGAHDLFLVDARAGFEATGRRDASAIAASGLGAFTAALGRFASSSGRDLAAVREAAKGARQFLAAARKALEERHASLQEHLRDARQRLASAKASADTEADTERAREEEFEAKVERLAAHHRAAAAKLAAHLRQSLLRARRRWIHGANPTALAEAVAAAVHDHADASEAAARQTVERLHAEMESYGTIAGITPRPRTALEIGELAPEERLEQAVHGNFQWLRRALWRRWYVPGIESLIGGRLQAERDAEATWLDGTVAAARGAAAQTLRSRLADIDQRASAETEQIKRETDFDASEDEYQKLSADLPIVTAENAAIEQIAREARSFL